MVFQVHDRENGRAPNDSAKQLRTGRVVNPTDVEVEPWESSPRS